MKTKSWQLVERTGEPSRPTPSSGAETRSDGRLLVYRGGEDTAQALEGLIEAERTCCSFLDLRIDAADDEVRVTVTFPPEARPAATELGIVGSD